MHLFKPFQRRRQSESDLVSLSQNPMESLPRPRARTVSTMSVEQSGTTHTCTTALLPSPSNSKVHRARRSSISSIEQLRSAYPPNSRSPPPGPSQVELTYHNRLIELETQNAELARANASWAAERSLLQSELRDTRTDLHSALQSYIWQRQQAHYDADEIVRLKGIVAHYEKLWVCMAELESKDGVLETLLVARHDAILERRRYEAPLMTDGATLWVPTPDTGLGRDSERTAQQTARGMINGNFLIEHGSPTRGTRAQDIAEPGGENYTAIINFFSFSSNRTSDNLVVLGPSTSTLRDPGYHLDTIDETLERENVDKSSSEFVGPADNMVRSIRGL